MLEMSSRVSDYSDESFSGSGSSSIFSGSSSESGSAEERPEDMTTLYKITIGLYSLLMVLLIAAFIWKIRSSNRKLKSAFFSVQGGISHFMFLFLTVRIIYFTLYQSGVIGSWLLYLNRVALLLLFTVFSLVLFRWIHSLERKFNRPTMFVATIVLIVALLNIVTYTIEITAAVLAVHSELSQPNNNHYAKFATFFLGVSYAFIGACFLVYGWRFWVLIVRFRKAKETMLSQPKVQIPSRSMVFEEKSEEEARTEWEAHLKIEIAKMFFFTILFTCCFGLRGFFWIFNSLHEKTWLIANLQVSTIVSYLVPEIPLSLAAIWISRGKWRPLPTSNKNFTPHVIPNSDLLGNLSVNSSLLYKGEEEVLFAD